jgi:hypothetical protein
MRKPERLRPARIAAAKSKLITSAADGADVGKGRVPTTLGCPGDDTAKRPVSLRTGIITNEGIESTT